MIYETTRNIKLKSIFTILVFLGTIIASAQVLSIIPIASAEEVEGPRYGGTFVWALGSNPPSIMPYLVRTAYTSQVVTQIFNTLVRVDWDYSVVGELAESWAVSEDGLDYAFYLKRDVTWHDGEPFTAADVEHSIKMMNDTGANSGLVSVIKSVNAVGDYAVVFTLKQADPSFLFSLSSGQYSCVLPKHLYEGTDFYENPWNLKPIGTGPYMFDEWVAGDHLTLVRNPNYFEEGRPYLDKIVFKIITDPSIRVLAIYEGEADFHIYYGFPSNEVDAMRADPNINVDTSLPTAYGSQHHLRFNLNHTILSNVKVRQALAYSMDREFILKSAYFDQGLVSNGPISKLFAWAKNPDIPEYVYDIDKANQLLDEAEYPRDANGHRFDLSVIYDQASAERGKAMEIWRENLKEVGIDLTLEGLDVATVKQKVFIDWDYEITLQSQPTGTIVQKTGSALHSSRILRTMFANCGQYNSSEMDATLNELWFEPDADKQLEYLYRYQEIVQEDLPQFFIWDRPFPTVWNAEFTGDPYILKGPYIYEEMDHIWWTKGDLPEPDEPEPAVSIETIEELTEAVETLVTKVNSMTTKISDLEGELADLESVKAPSQTMVYAIGIVALVVALYAAYSSSKK